MGLTNSLIIIVHCNCHQFIKICQSLKLNSRPCHEHWLVLLAATITTTPSDCCYIRGSYTEPRILMDSIRSPPGVSQESIRTSLNIAAIEHCQIILVYSRYTPTALLMDSIRMHTIAGVLIQSFQIPSRTPDGLLYLMPIFPIYYHFNNHFLI